VHTYGKDVPVEIYVQSVQAPKAILNPGVIGMNLTLEIQFIVKNNVSQQYETALALSVPQALAKIQVSLEDFLLHLVI
jgi:hypothetical protein